MTSLRARLQEDDGTSLIELVVGMAIMTIFMGMFTGAMLLMSNTVNKVQAVSVTSSQTTSAFLTLDREVRYASGVSNPAFDATWGWHVEFATQQVNHSTSPATQTTVCTQLRTYQNQLAQRTWTLNSSNAAVSGSGTAWKPLASGLTPAAVAQSASPFALSTAPGGQQTLTVTLSATSTPGNATSYSSSVYTALNSVTGAGTTDPASVCQQVGPGDQSP